MALQDRDRLVRLRAVEALAALADARSVAPLVQLVCQRAEHWRARRAATRALSRLGPQARSILQELAKQDSYIQGWARKPLQRYSTFQSSESLE